jgi:DNA-binding transcriptional ArsR family regulator
MTKLNPSLSRVFHALADPTRLAIVGRLARGPASVSALAEPFAMALPTVLKHVQVLEEAGLVRSRKEGRTRICDLVPGAMLDAESWLVQARAVWGARDAIREARRRGE